VPGVLRRLRAGLQLDLEDQSTKEAHFFARQRFVFAFSDFLCFFYFLISQAAQGTIKNRGRMGWWLNFVLVEVERKQSEGLLSGRACVGQHNFSCEGANFVYNPCCLPMTEPSSTEDVEHCVLASWRRWPRIEKAHAATDDAALVRYFMSPPEETDESRPDLALGSLFGWLFAADSPNGGLAFLVEPQGSTEKAEVWRALVKPLVRVVKAQDNARPKYGQFIHHPPPVESVKLMLQSSQTDITLGVCVRVRVCACVRVWCVVCARANIVRR
jgi:hypothetical protein